MGFIQGGGLTNNSHFWGDNGGLAETIPLVRMMVSNSLIYTYYTHIIKQFIILIPSPYDYSVSHPQIM